MYNQIANITNLPIEYQFINAVIVVIIICLNIVLVSEILGNLFKIFK